ncbi:nuclear transport factor 2 family protein [Flavobacteriaceae bacterium KMM 6897]|nr:nuclear transport factor 2 family protein [Flavobacteriaceae bacterium KMM 6897]
MKNLAKCLTQIVVTLFFIFSITSCNQKAEKTKETIVEPTFSLAIAKGEIVDANKEFSVLFAANDSIGLSKLYTQDAKFMNNGAPAVTGRKNIQSAISGLMNSGVSSANLTTIDVWGMENLITEEGELSLFVEDAEVYKGKYIVLWKKVDGKWKLFRDIFNSNLPAE